MIKRFKILLIFLTLLSMLTPIMSQAQEADRDALRQRKAAMGRLESSLFMISESFEKEGVAVATANAEKAGIKVSDSKIRVIIESIPGSNVVANLRIPGLIVEGTYQNLIQILTPFGNLKRLTRVSGVKFIRPPLQAYAVAEVVSEGVILTGADTFHSAGYTGVGTKVAILDLGFAGYPALLGSELPSTVVIKSFYNSVAGAGDITGGGEPHGTACAEIVHDMAPAASLYLVNFRTEVEHAAAVHWLIDQGVDIISYSIGWCNAGAYDGTGTICDVVNEAFANGIFWVGAMGNDAQRHSEGTFFDEDKDYWHEFTPGEDFPDYWLPDDTLPGDETIEIALTAGQYVRIFLSWDAWPETTEDYDLYLFKETAEGLEEVASSLVWQELFNLPPTEAIGYTATETGTYHIGINEWSTTFDHHLELYCWKAPFLEYNVKSSSLAIPADSEGSFSVGATYWRDDSLESFSGQGPTNDGRIKPDISAPDGVSSFIYGNFFGTSAAAPHVAGAASLVKNQNPTITLAQLRCYLETNAFDLGSIGKDNLYGAGRLQLDASPMNVFPVEYKYAAPKPGYRIFTSGGKKYFESWMNVRVQNAGKDAFNVTGNISAASKPASLIIVDGSITVGDIPAGGSKWSVDTIKLQVDMSLVKPDDMFYWVFECGDACGIHYILENVPQLPPKAASPPLVMGNQLPLWYPKTGDKPSISKLYPNYPNPFNPETWIPYQLSEPTDVVLKIFDARKQLIRTIDIGFKEAGFYISKDNAIYWDGRNMFGEKVSSGVYFYTLTSNSFTATGKMVILQ